jgi:threonylcarbamoyladenosine tRNA methylthiotransferase MtaB
MPGFHVENFGCRAARADGEAVSGRLRAAGHCVQQPAEADVVVVNTCSVTAEADREARAYIRRAHRLNPAAKIVVTGCYAQRAPEELADLEGVAAVVGNSHKALVPQIAECLFPRNANAPLPDASRIGRWNSTTPTTDFGLSFVTGHDFSRAEDREKRGGASAPATEIVTVQSLFSRGGAHAPIFADDRFAHSFLEEAQVVPGEQTRPNLKIQEGCGNRCTFCVIPQTRGSSRSLPEETVLKQVNGFVAAGGKELVLSGINLGRWGRDLPSEPMKVNPTLCRPLGWTAKDGAPAEDGAPIGMDGARTQKREAAASSTLLLAWLIRRIFEETDLPRLRLSSIEPMDWDDEMIKMMAEFGGVRLCRHAHLPLQSGSDAVLRRMHRRYRPWHYTQKVAELVRAAGPELTLGADVMVGFPGETDREFEETLEMVQALPFGYLHLFPFSARPGTRAWALHVESLVPTVAVQERLTALRELAVEKTRAHRERFVGRTLDAITLHTAPDIAERGCTRALTENFLPVEIREILPSNRLVRVRVSGLSAEAALLAVL